MKWISIDEMVIQIARNRIALDCNGISHMAAGDLHGAIKNQVIFLPDDKKVFTEKMLSCHLWDRIVFA